MCFLLLIRKVTCLQGPRLYFGNTRPEQKATEFLLIFLLVKISLFSLAPFAGYSKSWDVCSQLGQSESYQDLAMRQELMAFALTHCPPGSIELLLAASSSLQTEVSGPAK